MTPREIAERLGIQDLTWVEGLAAFELPEEGVALPVGAGLKATLVRLGVPEPDAAEVAAAAPDPRRTPELWWLLERCTRRAIEDLGRWEDLHGPWPELDPNLGAGGRCFWIFVYLAVLPHIRRWHQHRGIPDQVSWATLSDLGRGINNHRRWTGSTGLEDNWWYMIAFSGGLYDLGRLQYQLHRLPSQESRPGSWYEAGAAKAQEPGFRPGDPALAMHIPAGGRLLPAACDDSLAQARAFFPRYFPEHACRVVTCTSWLLDDQLTEHLPASSNIVRFQRRFELVPGARESDSAIFTFVFRKPPSAIDEIQPRTTLERAVLDHVRAGHHWRVRTGWIELGAAPVSHYDGQP